MSEMTENALRSGRFGGEEARWINKTGIRATIRRHFLAAFETLNKHRLRNSALAAIAAVTLTGSALVSSEYQSTISAARQKVQTVSTLAQTPCGQIEYADIGSGAPLLVVHGAGG